MGLEGPAYRSHPGAAHYPGISRVVDDISGPMKTPIYVGMVLAIVLPAMASPFIGAEQCNSCHPAEYSQWKASAHARATQTLSREQRRDPRCTSCHATRAEEGLFGVQCESCHGAGGHYWPDAVMRDPVLARAAGLKRGNEPATCLGCHTVDSPRLRPFNMAEALKLIRHGGAKSE